MKKILSFILGVCLILPCAFMFTGCKDKEPENKMETWDGTTIEVSVADNNGVIVIETAEELAGLAKEVNEGNDFAGKTIRLACDMDMAGRTWTPIGVGHRSTEVVSTIKPFSGIFDGNGKKIIGLTNAGYNPTEELTEEETSAFDTYHYGFFGYVTGATIKNLELTVNFNCDAVNLKGDGVGGVVGFSSGKLSVENCKVNGTIIGGFDAIAGIVGRAYNITSTEQLIVKNCVNNAQITGLSKVSGVVGYTTSNIALYATIDGCVNNGDIKSVGEMTGSKYFISVASGIVGYGLYKSAPAQVNIINNVNNGNIYICEQLPNTEELDGRDVTMAYAYIATQTRNNHYQTLHNYDFGSEEGTENLNTGKAYCEGIEKFALTVMAKQLEVESAADTYLSSDEANGTNFVVTPVAE